MGFDQFGPGDVPYAVAMLSCWLVGVVLTGRSFSQPAGWAFLGLGTSMAWAGFAEDRALANGNELLATFASSAWVWWLVLVTLAVQVTLPQATRPKRMPLVTVTLGVVAQVLMLLRDSSLESPFEDQRSPWAVGSPFVAWASYLVILGLLPCLLASVVLLVRAFRRARGEDRKQLLWLVAGVVPLAPCAVAAYAVSYVGPDEAAGWVMSLAFVTIAVGAMLSVLKYRLYDVERVVTDSAAYALASGAVIVAFGLVVVVISRTTPLGERSQLSTVAATLVGVVVARQSYVWARRAVDRKLNRTRFEAIEVTRAGLAERPTDLDALFVRALGDPTTRILYPSGTSWVTAQGHDATPGEYAVDVGGAKVEYDPRATDRAVVTAVAAEAAAEIDNVALRAELARQVEVVTESRARLATAHLEERRRIERDLHDGAQQRILAIALQLQSARMNGADDALREEVDRAVTHLGLTIQELRDLASGMQPVALSTGGLLAAVADLAERIPVPMEFDVPDRRFDAAAESAAWFVIAEGVSNAVKHAAADTVRIDVTSGGSDLVVTIADDGVGGADPAGSGLQGLHDRVAAIGGMLLVSEGAPGTTVRAVLPCG